MENSLKNRYIPSHVYDDINSKLDGLKEQSIKLNEMFKDLELKCSNFEIIQDNDINSIISTIRTYVLLKESCLEKSSDVISIEDVNSINQLYEKINTQRSISISLANDILHYAYEFLKITSNNIITDGLLQEHREKLKSIIDKTLKDFVDIETITEQLKPYKIAIEYITKKITDLTEYAELLNSTFGAILFYNIISGNNITYEPNTTINYEDEYSITISLEDNNTLDYFTIENLLTQENVSQESTKEDIFSSMDTYTDVDTDINDDMDIDTDTDLTNDIDELKEQSSKNVEKEFEDIPSIELEPINETISNICENDFNTNEEQEKQLEILEQEQQEDTFFNIQELNTEVQQSIEPQLEEFEEVEEDISVIQTTDTIIEEDEISSKVEDLTTETELETTVLETTQTLKQPQNQDIQDISNQDDLETLEDDEKTHFFKELSSNILENQSGRIVSFKENILTKDEVLEKVFNLIIDRQFCCASIILREYSHLDNLDILYNQFGLAVNDPLITDYDYSTAFGQTFDERLQPWFEICSLIRVMFKSENKKSESYTFELYMNSIKTEFPEILESMPCFGTTLEVFEYIKYNTDYIMSIKTYEQRKTIINDLKKQAKDKLSFCDQIASSWKNSKLKISNSLFSSNGGYLYRLIGKVSIGDLKALAEIKSYYEKFIDDNGNISKQKVFDYHEQLWTNLGESKSSPDFNMGYREKFCNKLCSILRFFQVCIEKTKNLENNYINDSNISKYKDKRSILLRSLKENILGLSIKLKNPETSKIDKVGMTCLCETFIDIKSYIEECECFEHNYYYVDLLKTGYFLLDDNYLPYTYSCDNTTNANLCDINKICGLTPHDRVALHLQHIQEDLKLQNGDRLNNFKDAIKYNVKLKNIKNVHQMVHYLNDTKLTSNSLQEYNSQVGNVIYNLENKSREFTNSINTLYVNEALCDRGIIKKILDIESIVKDIVDTNGNYGFYEFVISNLNKYAMMVSKLLYQRDTIISSISRDSEYYGKINEYLGNYNYSVADELIGMYFNNKPYPTLTELPQEDNIQEYNEIFTQFAKFYKDNRDNLDFSGLYNSMNDVYNTYIKPIANSLLSSDRYDYATSEELIDCWSKSENVVTNVVYDILANIGFGVEISSSVSNTIIDLKLSNSEKNSNIPYVIPQHTLFLNRMWNLSQAMGKLSELDIQEDTLVVLDYTIKHSDRKLFMDIIKNISNGHNVVVVDRCVILYLTTIPRVKRKLAFKVCSLFNINNGDFRINNFRNQYVEYFKDKSGILLGREGMGKTYILQTLGEELSKDSNNIVLSINSIDDTLEYPDKITEAINLLNLPIYSDTWNAFEKSLMSYLKKNGNAKVFLLIDNANELLENCATFEISPLEVFDRLYQSTNGVFNFVLTADYQHRYVEYIEHQKINYKTLKPLEYEETAKIFKSNLNGAKISISNVDVMNTLISKSFGYPKIVELISRQIVNVVSNENNLFEDRYSYDLTQTIVSKALASDEYISNFISILLQLVIGDDLTYSDMIPVVYGMVYILDENSGCSLEDIKEALNVSNIEENSQFNILDALQQLMDLNLILYINDKYYFNHNAFKNYLGGSEFAGTMLDEYSNMFEKGGIL